MRNYVRYEDLFTATGSSGQMVGGATFRNQSGGTIASVSLQFDGTNRKWGVSGQVAGSWQNFWESGTSTVLADTYYCIELYVKIDGSAGILKLWVDGAPKVEETGLDTDDRGNIDQAVLQSYMVQGEGTNRILYYDCVVVADAYIGPESAAQTYTKTWTTDTLFKKLGIPTTLSLDTAFQKQDIPITFSLDAAFQKSFTIQKQIDALFQKLNILETFGIDVGFLKRDVIKSFAVDARFSALMTHTISRQIDVLLKKLDMPKTFGLDAYFGAVAAETYAKTFGLDAIFAYKVRFPELWLDENGKFVLNISKPYAWVGS